jgi:hypothetical protein
MAVFVMGRSEVAFIPSMVSLTCTLDVVFDGFSDSSPKHNHGFLIDNGICQNFGSGVGEPVFPHRKIRYQNLRLMTVQYYRAALLRDG